MDGRVSRDHLRHLVAGEEEEEGEDTVDLAVSRPHR